MRWRPMIVATLALAVASSAHARRGSPPIPARTADNLPNVQSSSAIVVEVETGKVLYEHNADEVREIASTGKIFVGLVARLRQMELTGVTQITKQDSEFSRGGARTRLQVGYSFTNQDLLHALLVASDNRAPSALGRAMGLSPNELLAAMNHLAVELGLAHTRFTDPPGIRGNVSTAREMSIAFRTALRDQLLTSIMGTRSVDVVSTAPRRRVIRYGNTNKSLRSNRHAVYAGKTGYNDRAGYCLLIAAEVSGQKVAMVFLGSPFELTRYGDFNRVVGWLQDGAPRPESTK